MENVSPYLVLALLIALAIVILLLAVKIMRQSRDLKLLDKIICSTDESIFLIDENKKILSIFNGIEELIAGYRMEQIVGANVDIFAADLTSSVNQGATMLSQTIDKVKGTDRVEVFRYKVKDVDFEALVKQIERNRFLFIVRDIRGIIARENTIIKARESEVYIAMMAGGVASWSYDALTNTLNSATDNDLIRGNTTYQELLQQVHPDDRIFMQNALMRLMTKASVHEAYTIRARTHDTEYRYVNIHSVPSEYDQKGNVKIIIGSLKDITDNVNRTNEIIKLRDKAEEANKMKDQFLSNISHEVRTPLNAIIGFSNLIVSDPQNEDIGQFTEIINKNSEQLLKIISDVLDLSSIESGRMVFTNNNFNVRSLIQNVVGSSTFNRESADVKIIVDNIDGDFMLNSDEAHIGQIFYNLISNAIKFTIEGTINIGCNKKDDCYYFYVKDSGIGIPTEYISRVFDRFFKLDTFSQGTGLGLSISEVVVKKLGGEIGVQSELNRGSNFWFTIPINKG